MENRLRLTYPGGRMNINLGQFFPAPLENKKKLLKVIRESFEDNEDIHTQILQFLKDAENDMWHEKDAASDRLAVFKEKAKTMKAYEGVLSAAEREVKHFEKMETAFSKERVWWKDHTER